MPTLCPLKPQKTQLLLARLQKQLPSLLAGLPTNKLMAYQTTQNQLHRTDVGTDAAWRRAYTGFYVLRLPNSAF